MTQTIKIRNCKVQADGTCGKYHSQNVDKKLLFKGKPVPSLEAVGDLYKRRLSLDDTESRNLLGGG